MTVRTSKMLGSRKTSSKDMHRFGILKRPVPPVKTDAVPMVTYDRSRETEDALTRASLGRAIGSILLKGAQMSQ